MRPIYSLSVFLLYKDVYFEYTHCYKKTIINKLLDFLFKFCCRAIKFTKGNSYYFKETSDTKRFLLTFNKNNPDIPDAITLNITINHKKKKKKRNGDTIKNCYSTTQNYREPKNYQHQTSFYRTS